MEPATRVYSGQSADEREAARRERLVEAARALIGTRGYASTSVERICTAAKVSTRHFYLAYENKEALFLDLYEQILSQSLTGAVESLTATVGRPLRERVPSALLAYVHPMIEDPHVARIAFVEIMGVSPRIEARRLEFRERLVELVETEGGAAVGRGEITDRDFRFAALALVGAANAIIYDWAMRPDRPAEELESDLAALAVTLLTD
jgi:AcrR family transcriptional regulator